MDQNKKNSFMEYEESVNVLRGRFTKWLEVLVIRVKLNYLSRLSKHIDTISLDELIDKGFQLADPDDKMAPVEWDGSFSFGDERILEAIEKLPKRRREILEMLYRDGLTPEEAASVLGCTVQHIYNRRSSSLKALRLELEGGKNESNK